MKTNIKALELIEKGMTAKTVSKLTESQINVLHSKLISEVLTQTTTSYTITPDELKKGVALPQQPAGKSLALKQTPQGVIKATPNEGEIGEDVEVSNDPNKDTETQDAHQVGASTNDGDNNDDDGMYNFESIEEEKKDGPNPWAICHSQVGPKKSRKWERCVREVKKQLGEGKNPVSLFLENEIMKIVERNILPRITKGDLLKHLNEDENFATKHLQSGFGSKSSTKVKKEVGESEPAVAPTKPKTNPTTKPGTKPQKPSHPGKNPNPGENPAQKAKSKKEMDEQNPSPAPTTKPAPTKPGTKTPSKPRPSHPGKNPNPGENPAPKAKKVSPENAKNEVIDVIIKMLEK